ncbi:mucin-5AC-like isoform X3 [Myripristis murdjan]|uniref:mucin-5AC-like isoform X3 n=1 Tax=Myripristis murdjan TaxID=586833 RepID=UPI0011761A51|nr:mucin-5AC-like isoform X3 [Myripristis murdjan]
MPSSCPGWREVALEIVETEQAYVRDLKSLVEDYLGCIIDCGALPLKPEQVSTLFCNIEDIYEFNSDLLEDLERSPHAAAIAECFVERSEAFDIYTLYCMNYPNSVAVLRECMKNECLVRFFQERQTTLNHSLPLETYLLKPVQRILKYHLLLQELSKHFDKSDPGYEVVEDAIITMTAVAWYINDMKRKQEHAVRLQEIESLLVNWTGPDLSGFGELVLEGSFRVQRVKKERAFFLFDKMLLIAKKRLEHFVYSTHIFCCNLLLVETLKDPLCFKVSDQTIPKQQHVVQTKNQEEKRLWLHYLKRLIVENHPASLPQKARQVLGDNFCQSPQFDQENLKKSSASPRLDDIQAYHRGRRQSEPPELLTFTPEKTRKSLPLLLEGNMYRRTRRQSAPAKDIEAAFHPNALKQAGSEGELCPADSLGSAGSSSTLASSVIEVEAERGELDPTPPRPGRDHGKEEEEEEEEELPPLSPPPTLSITEEILQFINQSRAREGLTTIHTELDQPAQSSPPSSQTNFTCPLPPVACPPSPEQEPTMQHEQDEAKVEDNSPEQSQNDGSREEEGVENERTRNGVQEILEETVQVGERVELAQEVEGVKMDSREEKEEEIREEGAKESADIPTPVSSPLLISDLHSPIPTEKEREPGGVSDSPVGEATTEAASSRGPALLHRPVQSPSAPKTFSQLTKSDRRIIEKIRSYYKAAAEAEEEEEGEEEVEVEASRRRNSFSQIPSGLVKESVSRFDVCGHQGEPESERPVCETDDTGDRGTDGEVKPSSPISPTSVPSPLSLERQGDGQANKPISSMDGEAEGQSDLVKSTSSSAVDGGENQSQVGKILQSNPSGPVGKEMETLNKNGNVCMEGVKQREKGRWEERGEEKTSATAATEVGNPPQHTEHQEGIFIIKEDKHRDETTRTSAGNQPVMNGHRPNHAGPAEPKGNLKEPATALPPSDQHQKTETKTQSSWIRTKNKDLANPSGILQGLPSQIKVGRWSRHSRIVSANRALFEGTGSDVTGIGLFEAGPVVDPALMENSERILSKVQTLARMYSAKASTMKVPLHQKRACAGRNQTSASARPSEPAQNQTNIQTQTQTQTEYQEQTRHQSQYQSSTKTSRQGKYDKCETKTFTETKLSHSQTHAEAKHRSKTQTQTKYETQTHSETKLQSLMVTQTRQQKQIQTRSQTWSQTQTHYQTQTQTKAYSQDQTQTASQHQQDQRIQEEEKMEETVIKRAESLTNDIQEMVVVPCEPLLFGHVFVREQLSPPHHHQTSGYTFSRPRDFISALSQERDSIQASQSGSEASLSSATSRENLATLPRDQLSSLAKDKSYSPGFASADIPLTSAPSRDQLQTRPEDQSSSHGCSSSGSPQTSARSLDQGSTVFRNCSSTLPTYRSSNLENSSTSSALSSEIAKYSHSGVQRPEQKAGGEEEEEEEAVKRNGEVHSNTEEKRVRPEPDAAVRALYSVREDSMSVTTVTQSVHGTPRWTISRGTAEHRDGLDECLQDLQDLQFGQDVRDTQQPEYKCSTGYNDNANKPTKDVQAMPSTQSIHAGPEYKISAGHREGEVVLMVVSAQSQAPTEYHSATVSDPGLSRDEAPYLGEGGVMAPRISGGPQKVEPPKEEMKFSETEGHELDSLSERKMSLRGSTICSEEPLNYESSGALRLPPTQPLPMTSDLPAACHTVTEAPEGYKAREELSMSCPWSSLCSPDSIASARPPSVQSVDCLPTFTSQRPADLPTAMGKRALSNTWNVTNTTSYDYSSREPDHQDSGCLITSETTNLVESPNPAFETPGQASELTMPPSAFRPSLKQHSPSPVPACFNSSVRAPPCSSPFRAISGSSPTPSSPGGFTSPTTTHRSLPCFSHTPSSGRTSSIRAAPPSSPTPSSAFTHSSERSSSIRAGPPSSPTPSSSLRTASASSPTPSSAFTRSLAASCISQSISQSMAKKNTSRQQAPPPTTGNQGPSASLSPSSSLPSSSHLRLRSPSPKIPPIQQGSSSPAHTQSGCPKEGYQHPRCPPTSLRYSSPSPVQSPAPSRSQRSPSPSVNLSHYQLPSSSSSPSLLRSQSVPTSNSSQFMNNLNTNNNNNINCSLASINSSNVNSALSNGNWSISQQRTSLVNSSANAITTQQSHDVLWSGSHNRVARPFSASEPSSRVQSPSPSPSPSPASFSRLCSPPPQHNYSSPMANKPPNPRSGRLGGASPHNPLGLTLELPRFSSMNLATGSSSSCLSPRILSPPPIGVSVNVWTNNVAAPQPRNPRLTCSSPSPSVSSSLASPTFDNTSISFPTSSSSSVLLRGSRASSPSASCPPTSTCSQNVSQNLRRPRGSSLTFSSNLADRPPSPARSNASGLRRSWAESSRRSLCFGASSGGSFDQQESGLTSPKSGWSSYSSSPSCLSPRGSLQSPLLPSRLTPGKGTLTGQHFTSVPWPDVRELLTKYDGADSPDRSPASTIIVSSPSALSASSHTIIASPDSLSSPSGTQTEWGDPELEEGNCRSQLICAYVARPSSVQNPASSCLVLSSPGMTFPPPPHYHHQNHQPQAKPQPQGQKATSPLSLTPSPLSTNPSPLSSDHPTPTKPGNQKTSYATTVNLQIAGSGRITSFSTAQVSLTQTLQTGAGGPGQGQGPRRVSINGLSHLPPPSPVPHNCKRS